MKLFILNLLFLRLVAAQPPGTFTPTANMSIPRFGHTATLLPNGKVLIAGGRNDTSTASLSAAAELYDPALGTFGPTGSMVVRRSAHSATLLPSGKVLIAGGAGAGGVFSSAELYDPETGSFTATGEMTVPRSGGAAILLNDGKVLLVGGEEAYGVTNILGCNTSGPYPSYGLAFEVYDPRSGSFRPAAPFIGGEYSEIGSASLLANGSVLLVPYYFGPIALYNPNSGACLNTNGGTLGLLGPAASLLPTGKILFAGGNDDPGETTDAELYDPNTGMLSSTGRLTEARADHMAVLLSDGQVLLAGAQLAGGRTIASAEIYDPLTGMFRVTGGMNTSRCCASRTLLPSGDVLIAGGLHNDSSGPGVIVASAEIYHPSVAAPSPLLFSLSGDGKGQGSIWNAATGKISSTDNPAAVGDALSMYTTGLIKGGIILPRVVVDGRLAEIIFYGAAPGYPGYYQVNFRVPSGVAAGQSVPVRLTYIGRSSNAVTIGVK